MRRRELFILIPLILLSVNRIQATTVVGQVQQNPLPGCPAAGESELFNLNGELYCAESPTKMASKLFSCAFEVFGIVQGVFFRKHTQKQAITLGLHGWCMNTRDGTVKGVMEGDERNINEMKHWLQTKGSPSSRIDKVVFGEMGEIPKYTFNDFGIRR
ncbi:acylphosphatase-2-like [Malaya genurostris]|uniref:acylphosphatase-2-like n=1 Tax=Malaya genurostris TaxID=325434 RepID=UPI0026F3A001|nr:acylphosphatase-2-like [Malaya genurostris]